MINKLIVLVAIVFGFSCNDAGKGKNAIEDIPIDSPRFIKSIQMLDEDIYWNIVDGSLLYAEDQERQLDFLVFSVGKLSAAEIVGFSLRTEKLLYDSYRSDLWCAAHIMEGGCSDDAFQYFRNWLISRGKTVYYKAMENPDNLADYFSELAVHEFELFWSMPHVAFSNKTGKYLESYIDYHRFQVMENNYGRMEFNWNETDPETMRKICPRLMKTFWDR